MTTTDNGPQFEYLFIRNLKNGKIVINQKFLP